MEADALKNEMQDDDCKQEQQGVLEIIQHDGKWKQEQLWGGGNPQQQEHGGQKTYQ